MTNIPSVEQEILKWMNAYIPEGKTVPVFEDMLEQYATTQRTALLTELREYVDKTSYYDDWDCHVLDYEKVQAHLDELMKSTSI